MDEKAYLDEKYKSVATTLIERLMAEIEKATGLKVQPMYNDRSAGFFSKEPSFSIWTEQEYTGLGNFKNPTGDPVLRVSIGGVKARYPKRKDGTWNTAKIVKDVTEAAQAYGKMKEGQKAYEEKRAASEAVKTAELGNLVIPEGASVTRDLENGTYYFNFRGTFSDLRAHDVAVLAEALDKLTQMFQFKTISY